MELFKTWTFEWWEVGLIKVCLLSLGMLVGVYFYDFVMSLSWLWLVLFVATAIYFVVRFFREA
jgi:hypothetical protein